MTWESTDQFGFLKIAISAAETWEDLQEDLADLIVEMGALMPAGFTLHVDDEDGQVISPDPEQPQRILQCPWAAGRLDSAAQVRSLLAELAQTMPGPAFQIAG
jgi:hypothetical protein